MPERFQIDEWWLSQRRGSEQWCRTWFDRSRRQTRRTSLHTADFEEAKRKLAEWVTHHRQLKNEPTDAVSFEDLLLRYYEDHGIDTRSATVTRFAILRLSDYFAGALVSEFSLDRQKQFIDKLKSDGLSPGYITRILSVAKAALNFAYKRQQIASVPYIMSAGQNAPRERRLSLDESAALWQAIDNPTLAMYCLLAYNTLARPEALLELTWFQVDFENRLIRLNPARRQQTKKFRPTVPITDALQAYLVPNQSEFVIGKRLKSIRKAFQAACDKAGLEDVGGPYTIRRTMATELRKRSVAPWEVAGMLGHKMGGYSTTEMYAQYDPTYLSDAAKAIDDYMEELTPVLRASCVLERLFKLSENSRNSLKNMERATRVELATYTLARYRSTN